MLVQREQFVKNNSKLFIEFKVYQWATGFRGGTKVVHAERDTIRKLNGDYIKGVTIFTTLESCVELHEEQEIDSCAQLLIDSSVNKVVIEMLDPNGKIYSQGCRKLSENNTNISFF